MCAKPWFSVTDLLCSRGQIPSESVYLTSLFQAQIQKVLPRGVQLRQQIFYEMKYLSTTISGPSTDRQRNAISMASRWRAEDGPTLNAGLVAL